MNYSALINNDVLSASSTFTKNTWKRFGAAFLIFILINLIAFGLIVVIFGTSIFSLMSESPNYSMSIERFFTNMVKSGSIMNIVLVVGFIYALLFLLASWVYNFFFLLAKNEYENTRISFGNILSSSFSKKVYKIFGLMIISIIIMFLVMGVISKFSMSLLVSMNNTLFLIFFFFAYIGIYILSIRLILTIPSITIGDKGVLEAINFSWNSINFAKAFKYLLFILLGGIIFIILYFIFIYFIGLIASLGILGFLIVIPIVIFVYIYTIAFSVGLFSALYYKYSGDLNMLDDAELNYETHLVE